MLKALGVKQVPMDRLDELLQQRKRVTKEYFGEPLGDFYAISANRLMLYPFLTVFFLLECLAYWAFFHGPAFVMRHMAFVTVYSLHKAALFTACLWAADLLVRHLAPAWGAYASRSVGRQWLIWALGFAVSVLLLQSLVNGLVVYYAPEIAAYMAANPEDRPGLLKVIFIVLPYWGAGVFFALQVAKSKNRRLRLMVGISVVPEENDGDRLGKPPSGPSHPQGVLKLGRENGDRAISLADITHLSMEDHYCRVNYAAGNHLKNVLLRLPLKEMMSKLPGEHFLQCHRSHVVNLRHVSHLAKEGREYKVVLNRFEVELPVSRHRFKQLEPRLKTALAQSPVAP